MGALTGWDVGGGNDCSDTVGGAGSEKRVAETLGKRILDGDDESLRRGR